MKKGILVLMVITLLGFTGINSFAQATDARVRALQGEWKLISLQIGDDLIDFTVPPFNELMEQIWKFEENNLFVLSIDHVTGKSEAETSTFTIVGNTLLLTAQGQTDTAPYALSGNILTISTPEYIFTLIKQ